MKKSAPVAWMVGPERWMRPAQVRLEAEGWKTVWDNQEEGEATRVGPQRADQTCPRDLGDGAQAIRVRQLIAECGRIDALVYAPTLTVSVNLEQVTPAVFRQSYREPVKAAFLTVQALGHYFAQVPEEAGLLRRIVFVGSIHGEKPSGANLPWSLTASALAMLTEEAALELGRYGVATNLIAWGAEEGDDSRFSSPISAFYDHYRAKLPSRRLGQPQDLAEMIRFLLSSTIRHLNGARITMDGGLTLHYVDEKMWVDGSVGGD